MPKQLTSFAADCARDARSAVALQDEAIAVLKLVLLGVQHPQAAFGQADWDALSVAIGVVHDTMMHAREVTMQVVEGAENA